MPRVAIGLLSALAVCGACYDWTLGSGASDAGDATLPGGPDAGTDTLTPVDAPVPVDVIVAEVGRPDVSAEACASLLQMVDSDETLAKACMAVCTSTVTDQCGCKVFVAQSSSQATSDYASAIVSFENAGCHASCGTCADAGAFVDCLPILGPDGGLTNICYQ
jgi:hypothetical protein